LTVAKNPLFSLCRLKAEFCNKMSVYSILKKNLKQNKFPGISFHHCGVTEHSSLKAEKRVEVFI